MSSRDNYRDDRGRDYGRRDSGNHRNRSRSPNNQGNRDYRDSRSGGRGRDGSSYDSRDYGHQDRGRGGSYGGQRGHDSGRGRGGSNRQEHGERNDFASQLPDVPVEVEVPLNSKQVPVKEVGMRGTLGRPIEVKTNHFSILTMPLFKIFTYDLRFERADGSEARADKKTSANQISRAILKATPILQDEAFVFDGVSLGWSPNEIVPINTESLTVVDMGMRRTGQAIQMKIHIRNSGSLDIRNLVHHMAQGDMPVNVMGDKELEKCVRWIHTCISQKPRKDMVMKSGGNTFFDRDRLPRVSLESTAGVLEGLRGLFQTAMVRFHRLGINLDTATSVFVVPDKSFIEFICRMLGVPEARLIETFQSNSGRFFQICGRLLGFFFQVRHGTPALQQRKFRFTGWSQQDANRTTFTEGEAGPTISVADYFNGRYRIKLRYPQLPLAVTKFGSFPLEMCYSAAGERYKGNLVGSETSELIKFATCPASTRRKQAEEGVKLMAWHDQRILQLHRLSISTQMESVKAQLLPPAKLLYDNPTTKEPRDGRWNLAGGVRFVEPVRIDSYVMLYISKSGRHADTRAIEEFANKIQRGFQNVGIRVPKRPPPVIYPGNISIDDFVPRSIDKAKETFGVKPNLILVILPEDLKEIYNPFKMVCDVELGIATQFMLEKKSVFGRSADQYIANIALKVNVKLGGANHRLEEPLFRSNRYCLIGADLSLPAPSAFKNESALATVGMCASYDDPVTKYTGLTAVQPAAPANVILNAKPMFKELLSRYRAKHNGKMPESVIYFRDGMSESEVDQIRAQEGLDLRELCRSSNENVKITIIAGIKRHHTRFFPTNSQQGSKHGNVLPGTVVENSQNLNDSFIVSHADLQGTKRGTRYLTIVDENKLGVNDFHRLINGLCSSYARATTSVAVAPPIYYAHQIAERAALHIADTPGTSLRELKQVHDNHKFAMWWQ